MLNDHLKARGHNGTMNPSAVLGRLACFVYLQRLSCRQDNPLIKPVEYMDRTAKIYLSAPVSPRGLALSANSSGHGFQKI